MGHYNPVDRTLTLSLPQPVKFPGWMMHGRTCKQYIFRSYNIYFQFYAFWWRTFHIHLKKKKKKKRLKGFKFCTLWVVFKWHHGSEGVKVQELNNSTGLPGCLADLDGRLPGDVGDEEVHGDVLAVGVLVHLVTYGLWHHVAVQVGIVLKERMKPGHPHRNHWCLQL